MRGFMGKVHRLQDDDHRYCHRCRILSVFSGCSLSLSALAL